MRTFAVLGFATTHDALDAEALLEDMGIDGSGRCSILSVRRFRS